MVGAAVALDWPLKFNRISAMVPEFPPVAAQAGQRIEGILAMFPVGADGHANGVAPGSARVDLHRNRATRGRVGGNSEVDLVDSRVAGRTAAVRYAGLLAADRYLHGHWQIPAGGA